MKVEVRCKKLVKPSALAPHRREKLELSFHDELQPPSYVGIIFYYKHDADTTESDVSQRVRRMEDSLSKTLTLFYPFAGRYFEDCQFVDCNDEGVEFVVASVDGRIDQLIQQQPDADLLDCLSNFPSKISGNPLVTVQVNVFECGGLAVGLRLAHKIGDLYTMAMFMKSWTTACQGNMLEVIDPNFGLSSMLPMRELASVQWRPPPVGERKSTLIMNRFVFDDRTISKMKALIRSSKLSAPSRFEVVSALICRALINVDEKRHGRLRPFMTFMIMNLREKVGMPILTNACGNLCIAVPTKFESKPELEELVTLIGNALRQAKTKSAAITNGEELCSMLKDSIVDILETMASFFRSSDADPITFSSWCNFPLYENDFGWGKPALVSCTCQWFKSVVLTDNEASGGIDAWITLEDDEMTLFKQDPDVLALMTKDSSVDAA